MFRSGVFICVFLLTGFCISAQNGELYSTAFGKPSDPAVIYFHGGPGFNSANFEFSTAEDLAKKGLYVIVFDQRGSGRSKDYKPKGPYSFAEQILDVLSVYKKYDLKKATLMGHSWGGTLATKFADQHPGMVERLIFIGAPMSYQMTLKGILMRCKAKFSAAHDSTNLKRVAYVEKFDTASINYSASCFMFAVANGFYAPAEKSEFSESFRKKMEGTPSEKLMGQVESAPVQGVYDAEKYIVINMYPEWLALKKTIPLYGIYGSEDGLFDEKQLSLIENAVGKDHFYSVKKASHNVFIDKHAEFLSIVSSIFKL
ncbi:MAG: alpha/beta hydrolase [Bacteroidia bacterium]